MAARFVAIESLLLVCLLALTGYVFWETLGVELGLDRVWASLKAAQEPDSWQSTLLTLAAIGVCCLPIIGYWVLQWVGMTRVSFWLVTLAALLPQLPAALAYNRLDWPSFWVGPLFSTELSQVMVGLLFLLSLVLLVTLHRTGDLRRLQGRLNARRLGSLERSQVVTGEVVALGGLVGASLAVTALLLSGGVAVAQMSDLLARSPWTVLTIGGVALLLMGGFLSLWLHTRERE